MTTLRPELQALLDANKLATIATIGDDGRPHQSVVYYANDGKHVLITTLRGRAKVADVKRTGWASLSIRGEQPPYPSATFSGPATVRTSDIGEPTALVMARIAGTPTPPEPQTDEALADAGRVLIEVTIEHVTAVAHV